MTDVTTDYLALRRDVGAVWLPRDVVMVAGPDALQFLQGQVSQDVSGLGIGQAAWSLVLQPQGKVDALVRMIRSGDQAMVLDVDGGFGDALVARLGRFKLRTKADITPIPWRCLALRGPRAHEVAAAVEGQVAAPADWPGWPGVDLLGPQPTVPEGVRLCGLEAYESVRIEAGVPAMGAELTEDTIPEEAGVVTRTVSFTKGCFTGQELVARVDSRGANVARRLRGVVVGTNVLPPVGAEVLAGDDRVGWLTSVGESLDRRAPVALAYVSRKVEPPADVELTWAGAPRVPARVETLPLVDQREG